MRTELTSCPAAAGREAELRALMTMAAHDLNNPLASVAAHVAMLSEACGDLGEDFRRDLAAIERGLQRMSRLTQELLDYARADRELDLHPTPLHDMVTGIVTDHISDGGARVTIAGPLPTVLADAALLHHVLENLIGNAIKYTPLGTTPEVDIRAHTLARGIIRVEIADRGIGIPSSDQRKVFDAFHRCANSAGYRGTGLGLHICRRIIERHGGRIGVEANPGGGSCFWFTLPGPPRC